MSSPEKKIQKTTEDVNHIITKENTNNTNVVTDKKPLNPDKTNKPTTNKTTAPTIPNSTTNTININNTKPIVTDNNNKNEGK